MFNEGSHELCSQVRISLIEPLVVGCCEDEAVWVTDRSVDLIKFTYALQVCKEQSILPDERSKVREKRGQDIVVVCSYYRINYSLAKKIYLSSEWPFGGKPIGKPA